MGMEIEIANAIFGEAANQPFEVKKMVGSTIVNRMKANRPQEFGFNVPEILQKGYYAVSNPNEPYKQAVSGKFPDKKSEDSYKEALQVASGLIRGTIEPDKGHFYFTPKEEKKLRKKKSFNFDLVKSAGSAGGYNIYSY